MTVNGNIMNIQHSQNRKSRTTTAARGTVSDNALLQLLLDAVTGKEHSATGVGKFQKQLCETTFELLVRREGDLQLSTLFREGSVDSCHKRDPTWRGLAWFKLAKDMCTQLQQTGTSVPGTVQI